MGDRRSEIVAKVMARTERCATRKTSPLTKGNKMSLFKELEGDVAIVVSGGIFKQVKLFTRNGFLFAAVAGGYVRLKADGTTSKDKLRLEHIETELPLFKDRIGRLGTEQMPNAQALGRSEAPLLAAMD